MAAPAHGDVHSEPTAHAEIRVSRAWAYVAVFVFASAAMWLALAVARAGMGAASAWTLIVRAFDPDTEYTLDAGEIERMERGARARRARPGSAANEDLPARAPRHPREVGL